MKYQPLIFALVFLPAVAVFAELKPITLEEAISRAREQNPQIKASEKEVVASEARFRRTTSYFFPRVGAETRYEHFESTFQKQNGGTSNLFLEWNLFNGFRDWFDRRAKSVEYEQAKITQDRQRIFIKAEVEARFYKILAVNESIRSYEEALKRNESQKESARRRRSAGLASEGDIFEFDLYQTELEAELTKLHSLFKEAQAEFRGVLGETDPGREYRPEGKLIHYHVDDTLEILKQRVVNENQTLISSRFEVDQSEANRKVAFGGYLPQLDLKVSYGSRGINETEIFPETAIMGVARWEFFSGFDTYHARNEAIAQVAKAQAAQTQAEISAITQVESAYTRLKAIQDRVDIEAKNKIKAKKFFDIVASEYKRGVKDSNDLRAASQILLQVFTRDIQYRAEFFEQKALLEKAIGGEVKISRGSLSGHTD